MDLQYLVNVIRVRMASGELVFEHMKQMLYPGRIVYVDVRDPLIAFGKEGELQVAVLVWRFPTSVGLLRGVAL
jgi:hypothetical protein